MRIDEHILLALGEAPGYVSGENLASSLGVSRAAVNKAVQRLIAGGYPVLSRHRLGYRLDDGVDPLLEEGIVHELVSTYGWEHANLTVLSCTASTNEDALALAQRGAAEFTCVVAGEQTNGRGRRGKSFYSPEGCGVYLSVITRPCAEAAYAFRLTVAAACAVCAAIEANTDNVARVKWVNDVYVGTGKVCGILTEARTDLETGCIAYAISGIGVNVYEPADGFPEELEGKACALQPDIRFGLRNKIAASILGQFKDYCELGNSELLAQYRRRCALEGAKVLVTHDSGLEYRARVVGIQDDYRLLVELEDGALEYLSSAEASIVLLS